MKARSTSELLAALEKRADRNLRIVRSLAELPDSTLHLRPRPDSWNALQALEHINLWMSEYLPRTERAIRDSTTAPSPTFTSGWLGNKFAAGMKPGPQTRKVPTLKRLKPDRRELSRDVIDVWLENAERQRHLLRDAHSVDLSRVKVPTALTALIRMRLGDVLRMMVYHDWRHVEQAERATRGLAGIRTEAEDREPSDV
jgi:hypothetical protein